MEFEISENEILSIIQTGRAAVKDVLTNLCQQGAYVYANKIYFFFYT